MAIHNGWIDICGDDTYVFVELKRLTKDGVIATIECNNEVFDNIVLKISGMSADRDEVMSAAETFVNAVKNCTHDTQRYIGDGMMKCSKCGKESKC